MEIKTIALKFKEQGFQLWEVGGHVRDFIMGRESHDIDLTTDARPDQIKKILSECLGSLYTIGEAYGTIGFIDGTKNIEITTFRGEVYPTDSRKPNVIFGTKLIDDLARRDFTINAIARNTLTGKIFDPFHGVDDIIRERIVCVGSDERMNEDPLRMMRAIRFACQLGFELCVSIKNPERLKIISEERKQQELNKILLSGRATFGISKLVELGLMQYIIPEVVGLQNIEQNEYHFKDVYMHTLLALRKASRVREPICDKEGFADLDTVLMFRLTALLHDIGKPPTKSEDESGVHFYGHEEVGAKIARHILLRLKYSSAITDRVCKLISMHMRPIHLYQSKEITPRAVRRMVQEMGSVEETQILLAFLDCDLKAGKNSDPELLTYLKDLVNTVTKSPPLVLQSPLNGKEIMEEMGLSTGKPVGIIKQALLTALIEGIIPDNNKAIAIEFMHKNFDGRF